MDQLLFDLNYHEEEQALYKKFPLADVLKARRQRKHQVAFKIDVLCITGCMPYEHYDIG